MTLKRFAVALSLCLGLVIVTAFSAWKLVDDATLVSALVPRLETLADIRITYQGEARISRASTPTLSVEQLSIEDRSARYRVDISSFKLQLNLLKLLLGRLDIPLLRLGDTRITVMQSMPDASRAGADKTTEWRFAKLGLKPVLHQVQMGSITLEHEGEELHLPNVAINEIAIDQAPDADTLVVSSQIELAGETFHVATALPDFHNALRKGVLDFTLTAENGRIALETDGQVVLDKPAPTVQAAIRVRAHDISTVQTGVGTLVIPGALTANAQLAGAYDQLALTDISVKWVGPDASEMKLAGRIDNLSQLDGIQIQVAGALNNPHWLSPLLPDSVGSLKNVTLDYRLTGAKARLGFRDLSLRATDEQGLDLSLSGQFDVTPAAAALKTSNIDLALAFSAPTTHAARALLFERVPEFGAITGTAEVRDVAGAPTLQNISVKTQDGKGIDVSLSGSIARFSLEPDIPVSGYDLDVVMRSASTSRLAKSLGVNLPVSGPATLAYRIEGDSQAMELNQFELTAGEAKGISIGAQGQLAFGRWDQDDPLQSADLNVTASSHTTALLGALISARLPELGALSMRARLHTVSGTLRADDLRIQTRTGAEVAVSLSGAIDRVHLLPQPSLQGISLEAEAATTDAAKLNALFGMKDSIPAIGPMKARSSITGTDQVLLIKNVSITAGQVKKLLVSADGRLGALSAVNGWHLRDADLRIKAESSGSRAFADMLGFRIPELGPIQAQARLFDRARTLRLEPALVQIGNPASPAVKATGFVDDLFGADKTQWNIQLNMDGHTLAEFARKREIPDLGRLMGNMVITNNDGTLGIDAFELKSTKTALLSVMVKGRFGDFQKPDTLSLDASLTARDLQLIGALFDQDLPSIGPVRIDSKISQTNTGTLFNTALSAGDIRVDADLNGKLASTPPKIAGTITAQQFFFPDLLENITDDDGAAKPENTPVFSQVPIDYGWLKTADLDLSIDIASFNEQKSRFKSAKLLIALKSGRLSVKPATFVYPKGKLDMELLMDTKNPPHIRFRAFGEDVNPWSALDIQQNKNLYNADVDADVSITASGASPHELAANVDGDVYVTIKNGKLRRDLLDKLFVDMVGWTISKATNEKYYNVDCGIADYGIRHGVMTTKAFLIDASNIAISGEGSIDLGREQVDYALLPKKKSRAIFKADPVRITGPLNNPSVSVLPWKSAATTYGSLIFAPYIFVGLSAKDYLTGALGIGPKSSPCLEYEKLRKTRSAVPEK